MRMVSVQFNSVCVFRWSSDLMLMLFNLGFRRHEAHGHGSSLRNRPPITLLQLEAVSNVDGKTTHGQYNIVGLNFCIHISDVAKETQLNLRKCCWCPLWIR